MRLGSLIRVAVLLFVGLFVCGVTQEGCSAGSGDGQPVHPQAVQDAGNDGASVSSVASAEPAPAPVSEAEACRDAPEELRDVTAIFYGDVRQVIVKCGRLVQLDAFPALAHGKDVSLDSQGAVLHSREEVVAGARRALGTGSYDVVVAFPDGMSYAERLQAFTGWAAGARRARISGAAQMAALGFTQRDDLARGDEKALVVVVVGPGYVNASLVEVGEQVTEIRGAVGSRNREGLEGLVRRFAQWHSSTRQYAIHRAVVTGVAAAEADVKAVKRGLQDHPSCPVEVRQDLIGRGLLTQVGIFRGAVKDALLLVATPGSEIGIATVRASGPVQGGPLRLGAALDPPSLVGFTVVVDPYSMIPTQKTVKSKPGPGDMWLAERVAGQVTALTRLGTAAEVPTVTLDIDADMRISVNQRVVTE